MTLVSVLLPVHNGARFIESAARSILNQTHDDLELLVLDDGSTDGSGELVSAFGDPRVRILRSDRNEGLATALNHGLREARGGFIARQDADDLSHRERISLQIARLLGEPEIALLGSHALTLDEQGRVTGSARRSTTHEVIRWELAFDNAFIHSSVVFRKDVVLELGGYDVAWPYNQDFDLWTRLAFAHRTANVDRPLVACRTHGQSMTRTMPEESAAANRRLLKRGRAVLGDIPDAEIELIARAREGMDSATLARYLPLLAAWARAFERLLPKAALPDFEQTLARQYLALAFTRTDRTLGRILKALSAGLAHAPGLPAELLRFLGERTRLALGYDPLVEFGLETR